MNLPTAVRRIESLKMSAEARKKLTDELLNTPDDQREAFVTKATRQYGGPGLVYQKK